MNDNQSRVVRGRGPFCSRHVCSMNAPGKRRKASTGWLRAGAGGYSLINLTWALSIERGKFKI